LTNNRQVTHNPETELPREHIAGQFCEYAMCAPLLAGHNKQRLHVEALIERMQPLGVVLIAGGNSSPVVGLEWGF
jgi:hypothetical protein